MLQSLPRSFGFHHYFNRGVLVYLGLNKKQKQTKKHPIGKLNVLPLQEEFVFTQTGRNMGKLPFYYKSCLPLTPSSIPIFLIVLTEISRTTSESRQLFRPGQNWKVYCYFPQSWNFTVLSPGQAAEWCILNAEGLVTVVQDPSSHCYLTNLNQLQMYISVG